MELCAFYVAKNQRIEIMRYHAMLRCFVFFSQVIPGSTHRFNICNVDNQQLEEAKGFEESLCKSKESSDIIYPQMRIYPSCVVMCMCVFIYVCCLPLPHMKQMISKVWRVGFGNPTPSCGIPCSPHKSQRT